MNIEKLKSKIDCRNILKQKINYASNSNFFQYHFSTNAIQKQVSKQTNSRIYQFIVTLR